MIGLRDQDVHIDDMPLYIATSVRPPEHRHHRSMIVSRGPIELTAALKDSDRESITPAAVVIVQKLKLEGKDVAATCERFLTLMKRLVEYARR